MGNEKDLGKQKSLIQSTIEQENLDKKLIKGIGGSPIDIVTSETYLKIWGESIDEKLKEISITLIEERGYEASELKNLFPDKKIITCDFRVKEIGLGEGVEIPGGYELENIRAIDHHAPFKRMMKQISSANLAIEYVKKYGIVDPSWVVAINHVDCDGVLASTILRGILPPEEKFAQAAVAADHTGAENEISDLLQALEEKRDLKFSLRNLDLFLSGKDIESEAKELLEKRLEDRKKAKGLVEEGKFKKNGSVYYVLLEKKIDAGLLPALLPNAVVIMTASPMKNNPSRLEIHVRLGINAPSGLAINRLGLPDGFGGRWNAGANNRPKKDNPQGGTTKSAEEYAQIINEKLKKFYPPNKCRYHAPLRFAQ